MRCKPIIYCAKIQYFVLIFVVDLRIFLVFAIWLITMLPLCATIKYKKLQNVFCPTCFCAYWNWLSVLRQLISDIASLWSRLLPIKVNICRTCWKFCGICSWQGFFQKFYELILQYFFFHFHFTLSLLKLARTALHPWHNHSMRYVSYGFLRYTFSPAAKFNAINLNYNSTDKQTWRQQINWQKQRQRGYLCSNFHTTCSSHLPNKRH